MERAAEDADVAGMRSAARAAMQEDQISQTKFATRAGINDKTFSAWLNDAYAGDNQRVAGQVRTFLRSRDERVAARLAMPTSSGFVMTPSATAFTALLQQAQWMPDMVTAVGAPGVGKTSAMREYQRRNPNVFLITGSPLCSGAYALIDCLCEEMGIIEGGPLRKMRSIAAHLRGRQALIVVDEAQHFSLAALDQLRTLHDNPSVQVGIALVGHPDLKSRMAGGGRNGMHAQLDSRFGAHLARKAPLPGDVTALLNAEGIENEQAMKLLRGIAAEPGALRKMNRTLRMARMLASGQGDAAVTAQHITMAYDQLSNTGGAA